jgi:CBS domain containing-hemolysin-like protein
MSLIDVLLVASLLLANAIFVAAEFALVKVRYTQIEELADEGVWAARIVLKILNRLDAYISACQLGITLASLALGWTIEDSIEPAIHKLFENLGLPSHGEWSFGIPLAPAMAFLLVTFLHISLGELVPKSLAIRIAKPVALWTGPPLLAFYNFFLPIIWVLNKASDLLLSICGLGEIQKKELTHTTEELRLIVEQSVEGGELSRNERTLIENVLNLEDKTVKRVMVPRVDIVYLSLSRPIEDNLRVARQSGHTRYPLCESDLNTIIGMVHVKDLLQAVIGQNTMRPDLRKICRPIKYVPESQHLNAMLAEFQRAKVHIAMVVEEYGSTIGMVTLENVLEELVGPIQDEFDKETPRISKLSQGIYEVDASLPLDRLVEWSEMELPETDAETTGGFVIDQLGRLARPGDCVPINDEWKLVVVEADPNRIRKLRLEATDPASAKAIDIPEVEEATDQPSEPLKASESV